MRNQERLIQFDCKLNPRVMLDRLEPQEIDVFDNTLQKKVKIENSTEHEAIVKLENFEVDFEPFFDLPDSWHCEEDEPSVLVKLEDSTYLEPQPMRTKIPSGRRKKKEQKPSKTDPATKGFPRVLQILENCNQARCKARLHPKLIDVHNKIFHTRTGKEDLKMSLLESKKKGRAICPYCAKSYSKSSIGDHVSHY